ncbi:MAG: hypothetical protein ACLTS1_07865 [Coprococcus sp.]
MIAVVCLVTQHGGNGNDACGSRGLGQWYGILMTRMAMNSYQPLRTPIEQMTVKMVRSPSHGKVKSIRLSETHSITKKVFARGMLNSLFAGENSKWIALVNKRQIMINKRRGSSLITQIIEAMRTFRT